jgi:hypothetical protein
MASFLDQIPQFTPYIEQLPVDMMVKVGMQKQAQYEQGVQKIQSAIDNVAGLDIYKNEHKNYLQSKLNQLGGNLTGLAAGDFSNFQLVNSVAGMTNQIIKDPVIQTAVNSTARLRKEQANMEVDKKAGKSSAENEWWFNKGINEWLSDQDINAGYTGGYVKYTDVGKKLRDVADKIHELDNSIENPYRRDNAGNTLYYKKDPKTGATTVSTDPNSGGVPQIDDAILAIRVKGKPAEKILATFYDSLDENDKRQLMITSNYHYRDSTADTFKRDIVNNYNDSKKMLSDRAVNLAVQLASPNITSSQKAILEAQLNDVNTTLKSGSLEASLEKQLKEVDSAVNIDDFKYRLYTQKYLTNLSKDLSYQSVQQEYKSNPYAQMDMQRRDLQFRYDDANRRHNEFMMKFAQDERHWLAEYNYKATKDAREAALTAPVVLPGGIGTNVERPTLTKLSADIATTKNQIAGLNSTYGSQLFPNLSTKNDIPVYGKDGKTVTGYTSQRQAALDKVFTNYSISPVENQGPVMNDYLRKRRALELNVAQKNNLFTTVENGSRQWDEKINTALSGEKGLKYKTGEQLYTAKDLFDVQFDYSNSLSIRSSGGTGGAGGGASFDQTAFLNRYKGTPKEAIAVAYVKNWNNQPLTSTERVLLNESGRLGRTYGPMVNQIAAQKFDWQSNELAKRMPEVQVNRGTLSKENKMDMDRVDRLITQKINDYNQYGALDVRNKNDFSPTAINKLREKGGGDLGYTIEKKYDGSADLIVTKGGERQIVPMTAAELAAYFPNYAKTNMTTDIKYAVLASPNNTTNVMGTIDPVNAYLTGNSIKGLYGTAVAPLVRFDVEGDPNNDGSAADKFLARMYVNDNGVWKNKLLTPQNYVTEDGLQAIFDNIGVNTVASFLQQTK